LLACGRAAALFDYQMMMVRHIESLIFSSGQPITLGEIKACLEESLQTALDEGGLLAAIADLQERYAADDFSFEIVEISGGYQFLTKGAYHPVIATFLKQSTKKKLSTAALETLAIIAYRQPVTKAEAEQIRGVSCDYSIQKLLEKELIAIVGRSDGPGKPLLYATSNKFMDYFGLKSIKDLPKPKDFQETENVIGEGPPIEEEG
jgi:segregation and condensation protein B